jgi:hypothetical protein
MHRSRHGTGHDYLASATGRQFSSPSSVPDSVESTLRNGTGNGLAWQGGVSADYDPEIRFDSGRGHASVVGIADFVRTATDDAAFHGAWRAIAADLDGESRAVERLAGEAILNAADRTARRSKARVDSRGATGTQGNRIRGVDRLTRFTCVATHRTIL